MYDLTVSVGPEPGHSWPHISGSRFLMMLQWSSLLELWFIPKLSWAKGPHQPGRVSLYKAASWYGSWLPLGQAIQERKSEHLWWKPCSFVIKSKKDHPTCSELNDDFQKDMFKLNQCYLWMWHYLEKRVFTGVIKWKVSSVIILN